MDRCEWTVTTYELTTDSEYDYHCPEAATQVVDGSEFCNTHAKKVKEY